MRPASEWIEAHIQQLIADQTPENLSLDYKASAALGKSDGKKAEISKDASAMANSAGGILVYGLNENKNINGLLALDPVDTSQISTEWLEQVIDANIQRRVPGLQIKPVPITTSPGKVVYVVSIPQSNLAPHMAADHRYYKRLGTTTAPMEEYEVRDAGRRMDSPELALGLHFQITQFQMALHPRIRNSSPVPALYASIRLFVPNLWTCTTAGAWGASGDYLLSTKKIQRHPMKSFFFGWSVPKQDAILEGAELPFQVMGFTPAQGGVVAWEVTSPHMSARRSLVTVIADGGEARYHDHPESIVDLVRIR